MMAWKITGGLLLRDPGLSLFLTRAYFCPSQNQCAWMCVLRTVVRKNACIRRGR
jgi:hypothetical protein